MRKLKQPAGRLAYAVRCTSLAAEAAKPNELEYTMSVERKDFTLSGNWVVEVRKEGVALNGTKLHSPVQEMLLLLDRLTHRLTLELDQEGGIVKVRNYDALRRYWTTELRVALDRTYKGAYAGAVLEHGDGVMETHGGLLAALRADVFMQHYLAPYGAAERASLNTLGDEPVEAEVRREGTFDQPCLLYRVDERGRERLARQYARRYGEGTLEVDARASYRFDGWAMAGMDVLAEAVYGGRTVSSLRLGALLQAAT